MPGYLEVHEAKYSTDQEEAIDCLMATQSEQEQRSDQRYRKYGRLVLIQVLKEKETGSLEVPVNLRPIKEYENTGD